MAEERRDPETREEISKPRMNSYPKTWKMAYFTGEANVSACEERSKDGKAVDLVRRYEDGDNFFK